MKAQPDISVLVTAHNSARTIAACLKSIAVQRGISADEFEIILVDDRSTDNTADVARALDFGNLVVIRIEEFSHTRLTARQVAIDRGISAARGRIIFITDCDGVAPADWLAMSRTRMKRRRADVLAGPIAFEGRGSLTARLIGALQTLDNCFYLGVCRILNALGLASGLMFGNCAFRKEVYEKTGGFDGIGFALTEDLSFARAVHRHGFRLAFADGPAVTVGACGSFSELIRRARRTSAGGFSALALVIGVWMLSLVALGVGALVAGPPVAHWLLVRYSLGALFVAFATARAGHWKLLPLALLYEPTAVMLGLCVMISQIGAPKEIEWGGVRYTLTGVARE